MKVGPAVNAGTSEPLASVGNEDAAHAAMPAAVAGCDEERNLTIVEGSVSTKRSAANGRPRIGYE